jgi:diguanylate cyclase (GGDEF)-like protein
MIRKTKTKMTRILRQLESQKKSHFFECRFLHRLGTPGSDGVVERVAVPTRPEVLEAKTYIEDVHQLRNLFDWIEGDSKEISGIEEGIHAKVASVLSESDVDVEDEHERETRRDRIVTSLKQLAKETKEPLKVLESMPEGEAKAALEKYMLFSVNRILTGEVVTFLEKYRGDMDPLTSLLNKRAFKSRITRMFTFKNPDNTFKTGGTLLFVDVDDFRNVNTNFGHLAGDQALSAIAKVIRNTLTRGMDVACRWGGDEMMVFLPETYDEGAVVVAEKIRKGIEALQLEHEGKRVHNGRGSLSVSIGAASFVPNETTISPDELERFKENEGLGNAPFADSAFIFDRLFKSANGGGYDSKNAGRNRVSVREFGDTKQPEKQQ